MWLDRWLPWRHSPPAATAQPAPDVRPAPSVRPAAGWRAVPPIQRAVADPSLISPPERLKPALLSWRDPSFLAPLGHVVDPAGPAGYVHDAVIPSVPAASADDVNLPVAGTALAPAKPAGTLQRLVQLAGGGPGPASA